MQIQTIEADRPRGGIERFSVRMGEPERAARLPRRTARTSFPVRLCLFTCAALILTGAVADLVIRSTQRADAPAFPVPAAPPELTWVDVIKPIQLFGLSGSDFAKLPLDYAARRRSRGGERVDTLDFGHFNEGTAYLRLSLHRMGSAAEAPADFFVGLTRVAADANLAVTRSALPTLLPTRFGAFATADMGLTRGAAAGQCLGFRLVDEEGNADRPLDIAGLACGTAGKAMDRATLACVLDRLDLVSAGDDEAVRALFVAAEQRRRQECGPMRLLAPGSTRNVWLDGGAKTPVLKHLSGGPGPLR